MKVIILLLIGLAVGILIGLAFDFITLNISSFKETFWMNPSGFFGYKFHHSFFALGLLVFGIVLVYFKKPSGYYWIGISLGLIIAHTIGDGRLIFIEKLGDYLKHAQKFK